MLSMQATHTAIGARYLCAGDGWVRLELEASHGVGVAVVTV
jgi:hypothetical protein